MKDTLEFLDNLLKEKDVIIVACSGGPDSMCLLHVLNSYKQKLNLKIICAHVNHNLRKESKEEATFVKSYCNDNDIIFEYMVIDKYIKNRFSEEEGREKRYQFFEEIINKYNATFLATAHHGDDLIETILMRMVRGSNLKGYIGIPKLSTNNEYKLIRPLLYCDKEEIYNYLIANNVKFVEDKSNKDEKYTRNRFRKHPLPFLKNEDKKAHLKFLKFSEELEIANNFINKLVKSKIKEICVDNYIVINKLLEEDEYLQKKIIEYVIEEIQKTEIFNINDKQLNNILNLIRNKNNCEIDLADNFVARRSYNKLYIEKKNINESYNYIFENELYILNKYKIEKIDNTNDKSNHVIRLNSKELELPLIVRNKKEGDKIRVKNLLGTKKVKDIFIDCKIDSKKRSEYPIVTDSKNTIIWVPGLKKSTFDKEINEKYDIILKYTEE